MRRRAVVLLALVLLGLAPSLATAKPVVVVRESAVGGYVLGAPDAPLHIVEYMSFTCPHCAEFTTEGAAPLKADYIAPGKVTYEVRNALRDRVDAVAALLARCGGAERFFGNMELLLRAQPEWIARTQGLDAKLAGVKDPARIKRTIADGLGLIRLLGQRGLPPARLYACLNDKGAEAKIEAMSATAWNTLRIPGTPAFFINDELQTDTVAWGALQVAIVSATPPPPLTKPR